MRRLVNTKGMDNKTWLAYRRMGVCGSDTGIILGYSPYRSVIELWKDKTGQIPIEESENNFTHFGHLLEPVIRKEFERVTGLKVSVRNCIFQSETHPFMLADIDGIVTEPDGSKAIFEAKTAIEYKNDIWDEGKIPEGYFSQLQHYMAVTGLKKAYIACLVGGNKFYYYAVDRDDEYIRWLIEKERVFWHHVLDCTPPDVDASKATTTYLNQEYSECIKDEIVLPDEAGSIAEQYLVLDETIKGLKNEKELLANQLKIMMKEHEIGIAGNHKIAWKFAKRTSLDSSKLKEVLGERYNEYTKETSYRTLSVA
ncbi:MAG: YqaJ viral recombinase family protein [Anaerovoracaceae bacterium]